MLDSCEILGDVKRCVGEPIFYLSGWVLRYINLAMICCTNYKHVESTCTPAVPLFSTINSLPARLDCCPPLFLWAPCHAHILQLHENLVALLPRVPSNPRCLVPRASSCAERDKLDSLEDGG